MTEQKKDVIHVVISSLTEPPYAERHVRWCERGGLNHPYSIVPMGPRGSMGVHGVHGGPWGQSPEHAVP